MSEIAVQHNEGFQCDEFVGCQHCEIRCEECSRQVDLMYNRDSFNPSEFEMPTEDSSVPDTPSISNGSVIVDLRDNDDSSLTKSGSNKVFDSNWSIRRSHPLDDELLVPSPTSTTPTTTTGSDLSLSLGGPTITFHKLHYEVSVRRPGRICEKISKEILHDVSGMFSPGMNAILGPTGCGKTSLLNILAGRKDSRGLTGNVLVNGKKQPKNFKCMTGYVVQDDLVMGTLTVRENLMFSANLRLSPSILHETKKERVNDIIQELGLSKCADTKVGTEFIRGVSGGERKRTNIGMEMIVSPTVLFLDEPTTGLDASTANAVMSQLQRLSRKGRTIIFSIHQPRYSIFKQFDGLMLLASGRAIYHGPASDALAFFSLQSYQCEEHNNPPDFFLDVINGDSSALQSRNPSTRLSSQNSCSVTTEVTFVKDEDESQDKGYTTVDIPTPERREDQTIAEELSQKYLESDWCTEMSRKLNTTLKLYHERHHHRHYPDHDVIKPSKYATSFLTQVVYVSKRTVINIFRNPAASVMQMLVMVFFAFTIGIIYYQLNHDYPSGIQNRVGAFFFIIMVQIFGNISAVELFIKERTIFVHECSGGFYRVSSYFVAKLFCDLIPLRFIPLTAFAAITYFMIGLEIDVTKFFIYLLALFLSTMVAAVLTFFISASVRVLAIANIFIGLTYVLMMVFGGILVNLSSLAWYVRWIQYLSIVRYTLNVLCINELRDTTFHVYNGTTLIANLTSAGNDYLTEQGIAYSTSWDLWQNMVAMGAATFFLMILCYVQLRLMVKNQESK